LAEDFPPTRDSVGCGEFPLGCIQNYLRHSAFFPPVPFQNSGLPMFFWTQIFRGLFSARFAWGALMSRRFWRDFPFKTLLCCSPSTPGHIFVCLVLFLFSWSVLGTKRRVLFCFCMKKSRIKHSWFLCGPFATKPGASLLCLHLFLKVTKNTPPVKLSDSFYRANNRAYSSFPAQKTPFDKPWVTFTNLSTVRSLPFSFC